MGSGLQSQVRFSRPVDTLPGDTQVSNPFKGAPYITSSLETSSTRLPKLIVTFIENAPFFSDTATPDRRAGRFDSQE
jgi:hypothetical protein